MKKFLVILAIALTPFFIGSCEDDSDSGPDLTTDIVGTYTGYLSLENNNGTNYLPDMSIKVTKVNNSTILIEPSGQTDTHTFEAKLTEASDGVAMEIKEQDVFGGTLVGYNEQTPEIHGGLATEGIEDGESSFFYSLKVDLSGYIEYRIFMGSPAK